MVIKNIKLSSVMIASLLFSLNLQATPFKPITKLSNGNEVEVKANPVVKVGSEYKINGISYKPSDRADYDSVGIASWYGQDFQGKLTANGEIFDMNEISAAHNTLKLPSVVEVTNLDNGKKLIVRVNDRGPFSSGRIIDLSQRAAELLGFKDVGTARVRVKILEEISKQAVAEMKSPIATKNSPAINNANLDNKKEDNMLITPSSAVENDEASIQLSDHEISPITQPEAVSSNALVNEEKGEKLTPISLVDPSSIKSYIPRGVFVQIGAFSNDNEHIKQDVNTLSDIGVVSLQKVDIDGKNILRLRVGPYGSVDDAIQIKNRLIKLGYSDSRVIIEQ